MTTEDVIKNWDLIVALKEGKQIQRKDDKTGEWKDTNPQFTSNSEYRVKPEPKFVPFTFDDNLLLKKIIHKEYKRRQVIIYQDENGVMRASNYNVEKFITYSELLKYYTFEQGQPCGKLIK